MTGKGFLAQTLARIRATIPSWFEGENDRLVKALIKSGAASDALKVGDRIPDFMLPNAEGRLIQASDLFDRKALVISFYRGIWCPYCAAELNALADVSPGLREAGATVVAITPEVGGAASRTKLEHGLDFEILCDVDNGVAMDFGLVFRIPDDIQAAYMRANVRLPPIYGNDSWMLPIPATYVAARDRAIVFAYVNPDYRERCDPADILEVVQSLT